MKPSTLRPSQSRPSTFAPGSKPLRRIALPVLALAGALLSGCQTDGTPPSPLTELANYSSGKPQEAAKPVEPPMTRARAATECWMKTEKGRGDASLDQRADLVTKCIDDKLKSAKVEPKT